VWLFSDLTALLDVSMDDENALGQELTDMKLLQTLRGKALNAESHVNGESLTSNRKGKRKREFIAREKVK